ncbi:MULTISPECIES: LysR family transcriptional regulator [Streptomycetaceae]|uniref:LysR family transcriptional regulator n=1 Tax=Streptantibioticus cattleyicolor (strain ATCC 35852 / DSM 46488 / JCM 4925 / NBRC 14057 / NRRL 8057) TaxID=1003195 RepID=F8JQH1_STREN|nr:MULTISPECIES: LysR family transcriptional regulator [Streptomycetaceae]AEW97815.1 LysR family transcriptional regulator [Streptantibioticus cattleyicolor NRRL 8057 = DSM 46488]MYS62230.1 LysR family transcriptional regulator [Streptomyces sp. SID5468]CCB78132.1 Transcriptional regulator, LysR family [Streptantibioticus cattleyicolor NRRL 8057 = DSM 46488]
MVAGASGNLPDLLRLRLLLELSRVGTMAEVARRTGYGTSAVSKHLAVLEQEVGVRLLTPAGRRVQLTPAGERLAEHAVGILARVEQAAAELCGESEPVGRVRLASFFTAMEPVVLPALVRLRAEFPRVEAEVSEHEPEQTVELVLAGDSDLGVVYDYSLVPRELPPGLSARPVDEQPLYLAVPAGHPDAGCPAALADLRALADSGWIANSRGTDDDELVQRVCAMAGFVPRIAHRVDSLHLVNSLTGAGLGVALLAESGIERHRTDVAFRRLDPLAGVRRSSVIARRGRWSWPPVAAVARALLAAGTADPPG